MDDDRPEMEMIVIEPQRHNRWAVIAPALDLVSNIASEVSDTFKMYAIFAAQHGCQLNYDSKFREVIGGNSGEWTGTDVPKD